jgi:hypothetical protein
MEIRKNTSKFSAILAVVLSLFLYSLDDFCLVIKGTGWSVKMKICQNDNRRPKTIERLKNNRRTLTLTLTLSTSPAHLNCRYYA